jgi:hypothetical protein
MSKLGTPFSEVYDNFLSKITDDMYMELTVDETRNMLKELLKNSLYDFEFPRVNIFDYNEEISRFNNTLSSEEINILGTYMIVHWLDQQLATIDLVRMKYSGTDFKFTSQANHIGKLQSMKEAYLQRGFHLQRLYKRRISDESGIMHSTITSIMFPEEEYYKWK